MTSLPSYYTRLGAFESRFREGLPILTYHKVGRRPWGARLKGLYVSPKLFRTQILELHRAGYQTFSLSRFEDPASRPQSSLALTFDDGFQNVLENAMKPPIPVSG